MIKSIFIFRDIRLENILLNSNGYCKITGFSCSLKIENNHAYIMSHMTNYSVPEYFINNQCEYSADYWGLGLLNYQMVTGNLPFSDAESIKNKEFPSLDKYPISPESKEFISNLLEKDKYKRLGSIRNPNKARDHSFFKKLDWEKLEKGELEAPFIPTVVISFIYFYDLMNFNKLKIQST